MITSGTLKFSSALLFLVVLLEDNVYGQELNRSAQATMTFLNIDPVARSVGMGSAATCLDGNTGALFHNLAGLAAVSGVALSVHHTDWLVETKQYAFGLVYGTKNWGTFGSSLIVMDNGDIPRTIPDASSQGYHYDGTFSVIQLAVGVAYARRITDQFSVGGQLKYVLQDLGPTDIMSQTGVSNYDTLHDVQNRASRVALDFGTMYYPGFKDFRLGISLRNFATSVKYAYNDYELPLVVQVGIAMNLLSLFSTPENQSLQACVEAVHPNDYSDRVHVGLEYGFRQFCFLRAGYRFNYDEGGFSAGLGLSSDILKSMVDFDYAYSYYGRVFGAVHRLSLGFKL